MRLPLDDLRVVSVEQYGAGESLFASGLVGSPERMERS
jgi:hypothetical protein